MEISELQHGYIRFIDIKHIYDDLTSKNRKSSRFSGTYETISFNITITLKSNPKRINVAISCEHEWICFFTMTQKKLVDNVSTKMYNPFEDKETKMYISNFSMMNSENYTNTKVFLSMIN